MPADPKLSEELLAPLRPVLESMADGALVFNRRGVVIWANRAALGLLGFQVGEIAGMGVARLLSSETVRGITHELARNFTRAAGSSTVVRREVSAFKSDGAEVPVDLSVTWLIEGATDFLLALFRDLSERRLTEEALAEQSARLREQAQLLELAHDAIFVRDLADARITYWNQGAVETYGIPRSAAVGTSSHDLLQTIFPDPLPLIMERLLASGRWSGQLIHVRPDGVPVRVDSRWAVLNDDEGRPVQVLEINRDVTMQQKAIEEQRAGERRYRAIFDRSAIGICRVAMDGTILDSNQALDRMLGFSPGEFVGKSFVDVTDSADVDINQQLYAELATGKRQTFQIEKRYRCQDGSLSWGHLTVSMVTDPGGGPAYFVAMVEDINERKRAQADQEEAYQRLFALNTAKSHFVSVISHEFRTALTGIQGFSEMMRDEELPIEEYREYSGDINRDALRLNRLITELLDLDRMESGQMGLNLEDVRLDDLVRRQAQSAQPALTKHQLLVATEPVMVRCDGDKLIQVFSNLLSNAVKYSPAGGAVRISCRAEGEFAVLSVSDPGIGIAAESIPRMFERFARIEEGAGRYIKGTGLGLPIVKSIVEMHAGRIEVASELGAGTTLTVRIPVAGPAEQGSEPA